MGALKVQLHPMIAWVGLGGLVVVLDGLAALWPQQRRALATIPGTEPARLQGEVRVAP